MYACMYVLVPWILPLLNIANLEQLFYYYYIRKTKAPPFLVWFQPNFLELLVKDENILNFSRRRFILRLIIMYNMPLILYVFLLSSL